MASKRGLDEPSMPLKKLAHKEASLGDTSDQIEPSVVSPSNQPTNVLEETSSVSKLDEANVVTLDNALTLSAAIKCAPKYLSKLGSCPF